MTTAEDPKRLIYGFGHLVSSCLIHAHSGDSGDLAREVFAELGISKEAVDILECIAEEVAGNYQWTGAADAEVRAIEGGA